MASQKRSIGKRSTVAQSLALAAAGAAAVVLSSPRQANAAIDVVLSQTTTPNTTGASGNGGIVPVSYTPGTISIPDAPEASPTQTYDAADMADTGTLWNTLLAPTTAASNTTGSNLTVLYEQQLPLVDSLGNSTNVQLSVSFTENNNKNDTVHHTGVANITTNTGTDGLLANPQLPAQNTPSVTGLVGQSWSTNGTSESISFGLTGLVPGEAYNLFVYGAGPNAANGGTFTVPALNQGTGYNATSGAYSTEPNKTGIYRSVFDSTGINPLPEEGLSWTELPVVADSNGDLTFTAGTDVPSASKGYINGFQLDTVPEPTSLGLLAIGSLGLLTRMRKRRA